MHMLLIHHLIIAWYFLGFVSDLSLFIIIQLLLPHDISQLVAIRQGEQRS